MSQRRQRIWNRHNKNPWRGDPDTELDSVGSHVERWSPVAATLEVLSGPDEGRLYLLDSHGAVLGRDADCDLALTDRTISRRHAQVVTSEGVFYLRDLDSPNGTYLDEQRVERLVVLGPRCRVQLGRHTRMDFTIVDAMGLDHVYRRFEEQARLRVQLEYARRLREQAQRLKETVADLELFTRSAAHDLASPLQGIALHLTVLLDDTERPLDDEQRDILEDVSATARRMGGLLTDLTSYARLRDIAEHAEPVVLDRALEDALSHLGPAIAHAEANIEAGALPMVMGNRSLLTVLLQNLVGNAVKFRRGPGPTVRVRAAAQGERWEITVEDDGIGIPDAEFDAVFQPFTRLRGESEYRGTGMGLAIAQRIVRMHNGRIWATAGAQHGTTMHVVLPDIDSPQSSTLDSDDGGPPIHTLD